MTTDTLEASPEFQIEVGKDPVGPAVETIEERLETARDLRLAAREALGADNEDQEFTIEDRSPRRKLFVMYSMKTGERLAVPRFLFNSAINRLDPETHKILWTAHKARAPREIVGKVLCFLHPNAPERGVLDEIGVTQTCKANELRSALARRMHAENKHPMTWAMYQEHVAGLQEDEDRAASRAQTAAIIELASRASGGLTP